MSFVRLKEYDVADVFINRWSPRAFIPTELSKDQLKKLFEAARWAPSAYNNQPWRFVYATRGAASWQSFVDLLVPFNQLWASNTSVLVIMCARQTFEYNNEPSKTHAFDTGAAWMSLALQAQMMGLAAHGMQGFDYEKAAKLINLPADHVVLAMCAIGVPGDAATLPPEMKEKEFPSERKLQNERFFEGSF